MRDTTKDREAVSRDIRVGKNVAALAGKVLSLQTHDKLLLAADLLLANQPHLAMTVAKRATDEIELALLFVKTDKAKP